MPDLERALIELGGEIEFPPTPELRPLVAARIAGGKRPRPRRKAARVLVLAFAIFVLAAAAAFAVPASRDAILDWLGLQGATVERVATLPEIGGTTRSEATLIPGRNVAAGKAARLAGFPILRPSDLGEPDEIHVDGSGDTVHVTLVYAAGGRLPQTRLAGVGMLLTELRGDLAPDFIGKLAGPDTVVEEVTVDGEPGIWLEGAPHEVFFRRPDGKPVSETLRLAGNTLLWEHRNLLLRLEADVTKATALGIARSIR